MMFWMPLGTSACSVFRVRRQTKNAPTTSRKITTHAERIVLVIS